MRIIAGLCIITSFIAIIGMADKGKASSGRAEFITAYIDEDFSGDYYIVPIDDIRVARPLPGAYACDATLIPGPDDAVYVDCGSFVRMGGRYV